MNASSSTRYSRLTEAAGVLSLIAGLLVWLSLVSYHPEDPSWNTAARVAHTRNLIGPAGAYFSDLFFQVFGALSFALPIVLVVLAWKWVRARRCVPLGRGFGYLVFIPSGCAGFELGPQWTLFHGAVSSGGMIGVILADYLVSTFNLTGASIVAFASFLVSLYLASSFRIAHLSNVAALGSAVARPVTSRWRAWRAAAPPRRNKAAAETSRPASRTRSHAEWLRCFRRRPTKRRLRPMTNPREPDIPIRTLEDLTARGRARSGACRADGAARACRPPAASLRRRPRPRAGYRLPPTSLLNEPPPRPAYDEEELKQTPTHSLEI